MQHLRRLLRLATVPALLVAFVALQPLSIALFWIAFVVFMFKISKEPSR